MIPSWNRLEGLDFSGDTTTTPIRIHAETTTASSTSSSMTTSTRSDDIRKQKKRQKKRSRRNRTRAASPIIARREDENSVSTKQQSAGSASPLSSKGPRSALWWSILYNGIFSFWISVGLLYIYYTLLCRNHHIAQRAGHMEFEQDVS